jgi:hypothetical protein
MLAPRKVSERAIVSAWVRLACRPHSGHGVGQEREAKVRTMAGGRGSNVQVSSRAETGSGNKRERRFTPQMW